MYWEKLWRGSDRVVDDVRVTLREESIANTASTLTQLRSVFGVIAMDAAVKESQQRRVQLCRQCACATQHRDGTCLECGRWSGTGRCRPKGDGTR